MFGTRVADPTEFAMLAITAAQNVMVCFEMFLAAVFHHFIFPAAHFRIRPKHKPDETNKVEDSGQSGSSENDQEVRRPTVGPGEAFLEVFDAREVSHLVTSWYSDRFDGTKRVSVLKPTSLSLMRVCFRDVFFCLALWLWFHFFMTVFSYEPVTPAACCDDANRF